MAVLQAGVAIGASSIEKRRRCEYSCRYTGGFVLRELAGGK